jgi:hypothetical protein
LEKAFQSRTMKSYFLKRHSLEEIKRLMRPDFTITSLRRLQEVVQHFEKGE